MYLDSALIKYYRYPSTVPSRTAFVPGVAATRTPPRVAWYVFTYEKTTHCRPDRTALNACALARPVCGSSHPLPTDRWRVRDGRSFDWPRDQTMTDDIETLENLSTAYKE